MGKTNGNTSIIKVKEDLLGKTFGNWRVIKRAADYATKNGRRFPMWGCLCGVCGGEFDVAHQSLIKGKSKSCFECSRQKAVDLVGQTFGRLTVTRRAEDYVHQKTGKKTPKWECVCSCNEGKTIITTGNALKSGATKSCGCWHKEHGALLGKNSKKQNSYSFVDGVGIGTSSNTDDLFYFDEEDFDKIKDICWCVKQDKGSVTKRLCGYVVGSRKIVYMYRILGFKNHDHRDRDQLNNCKDNLRQATLLENCRNKSKSRQNKSGVLGVFWDKRKNRWRAGIGLNNKEIYLGVYESKDDAIIARLEAEKRIFKDFAPQQHMYEHYNIV